MASIRASPETRCLSKPLTRSSGYSARVCHGKRLTARKLRSRDSTFSGTGSLPVNRSRIQRLTVSRTIKAESTEISTTGEIPIDISFVSHKESEYTEITVKAGNRPGVLSAVTSTLKDLGIMVERAEVMTEGELVCDKFYVTDKDGRQIKDTEDISYITVCLETVVGDPSGRSSTLRVRSTSFSPDKERSEFLYNLMDKSIKNDVLSIQESIVNHVEYTIARSRYSFDDFEAYQATAYSVRDRLIESWNDTQTFFRQKDPKRVYYLSMEFLTGRTLLNSLYNLGVKDAYNRALTELGYDLEALVIKERDAALGNGGLGRLAACFLDSMATLSLPAWGYGIRYQYGMFRQSMSDGFQREAPDYWLTFGNPWEIIRPNVTYPVKFYGHVSVQEKDGKTEFKWVPGEQVEAVAYDNPIPGWNTNNVNNLRLWSAKPMREFDLESFHTGDYVSAILSKQRAETLSAVLYPDDRTYQGKELRLKQQHFLVSATLQDILRRYKRDHTTFDEFPNKVALQLNDTHPVIGIPELMRLLIDEQGLGWTDSWDITTKVYAFTNHTVLPEALEKWPVDLVEKLLPRHMQIIYDINWRFLQELRGRFGEDYARMARMSIIEEGDYKTVRMAHLALVCCHTVNGVAAIHSELIKTTIFKEFYDIMPQKFQNKTNGVTQRRWLSFCNPRLGEIITEALGTDAWIGQLDLISGLREFADDEEFQAKWRAAKQANKKRLATTIHQLCGVEVSPNALFDIQVKRIHEYKRQLLNVLGVIYRYKTIKAMTAEEKKAVVPRVVAIGGKAAPGYEMAKGIIKLVNAVSDVVNADPEVGDLLKMVFLPDYNVSLAEVVVPGSDLSQHISTAGTEASGTSNMKFAMNGCLILGTMDGANVELAEEIGEQNMFIFGLTADKVPSQRAIRHTQRVDERFYEVLDMISSGYFGWADFFTPIVDAISGVQQGSDYYLLGSDFEEYLDAQERVDEIYKQQEIWTRMSILSTAGTAKFSSDRTIKEYAAEIWDVKPCKME